jgi:hypothetical protein
MQRKSVMTLTKLANHIDDAQCTGCYAWMKSGLGSETSDESLMCPAGLDLIKMARVQSTIEAIQRDYPLVGVRFAPVEEEVHA